MFKCSALAASLTLLLLPIPSIVSASSELPLFPPRGPWSLSAAGVELGVLTDGYLNPDVIPDQAGKGVIPALQGQARTEYEGELWNAGVSAGAGINPIRAGYRWIHLPEAWTGIRVQWGEPQLRVQFGRRLRHFSEVDHRWQLGVIEQRLRFDPLRPDPSALTGFFAHFTAGHFQAELFGSFLYIPEFGPSFRWGDGKLTSLNPFFVAPPSSLFLFERLTTIRYDIQTPPLEKILLQPSVGGTVSDQWGPIKLKLSAFNKPSNSLNSAMEGYLYFPADEIQVNLRPAVVRHTTLGADLSFHPVHAFRIWGSVLGDLPGSLSTPEGFTTQAPVRSWNLAVGTDWQVTSSELLGGVLISTSAYHSAVSSLRFSGSLAPAQGALFETSAPFRTATALSAQVPIWENAQHGLGASAFWIQEWQTTGTWLSASVRGVLFKRLRAEVGIDILGASNSGTPEGTGDFIARYRAYDRIRGQVSYAF